MKTKLQSGQTYSLSELFCKDRKIIIPDLQRDYCWGDRSHGESKIELVSGFIDSLFEAYKGDLSSTLQMGMIYAYENPVNHIQLCDGQQRITTLYLLMGMLYKITKSEAIKKSLISDFELNYDDKEPYLQYAIRESTLYFLSDLVCEFFLKNKNDVTQIKQTSWYFSEYNLDPTIQSMISALDIIENKLKGQSVSVLSEFSTFLLQNIKFFYFDMINRQHGEEMFVVINTTGEPLTATENLKPALIGNIENEGNKIFSSNLWEKWEKWFWQNKHENEHEADSGLNDFFNWYWQIKLKQENDWSSGKQEKLSPIKLFKERPVRKNESEDSEYSTITYKDWDTARSIGEVDRYFSQLTILYKYFENESYLGVFQSIQKDATNPRKLTQVQILQVILPLIEYMVRFPANADSHLHFLRRLRKNYYDEIFTERKHNHVDWRHIIEMTAKCHNPNDVLKFNEISFEFKKLSNVNSNISNWYNSEEQFKVALKEKNSVEIEKWEDNKDFMGDLTPLFEVVAWSEDFNILQRFYGIYNKIRVKEYQFSDSIEIENLYRLDCLIENGHFEHRGVGGYGYCMLVEFDGKLFLQKGFNEIWRTFVNEANEIKLKEYFILRIKRYFEVEIFKFSDMEEKLKNTNTISHYNRIKLWAILEYLYNQNIKLDFSKSIACFWEYPNLIHFEDKKISDKNDYQIGNLLLGNSYSNNKSGWLRYDYPLMQDIKNGKIPKDQIEPSSLFYVKQITEFLSFL